MCTNKIPCSAPDGGVIYRPCGKCLDCLRQYQQDWTSRISEEFKAWSPDSCIYFTLTYSDEHLPVMVTYNHPITCSSFQAVIRYSQYTTLAARFKRLGLDSFFYTRPIKELTRSFKSERRVLQDSYLDIPEFERPALFVPTAYYDDVNQWIRYCRKWFDRHVRSVPFRDRRVNPYLKSLTFKNIHGVESCFPDSAYTPSFKYWITSEYGAGSLRPHYHGFMFGVSEEIFRDVFAPYWTEHFGSIEHRTRSVKFDKVDFSKGGAMYVSKYCSKGSFDHPLVSKSIHYPSGKEFITNKYINCERWFGFDFPLCMPPFRLISKGIGIRYPFSASLQRYWDVQCDEFTDFVTKDSSLRVVPLSFLSSLDCGVTLCVESLSEKDSLLPYRQYKYSTFDRLYSVSRIESSKRPKLLGLSEFVIDPHLDESDFISFENRFFNKKYIRVYHYEDTTKEYSALLPRYYRRFLLSPFTQTAIKAALSRKSDDDFNREREEFKSFRRANETDAWFCQNRFCEMVKRKTSQKDLCERYNKFYSRPFVGDL